MKKDITIDLTFIIGEILIEYTLKSTSYLTDIVCPKCDSNMVKYFDANIIYCGGCDIRYCMTCKDFINYNETHCNITL